MNRAKIANESETKVQSAASKSHEKIAKRRKAKNNYPEMNERRRTTHWLEKTNLAPQRTAMKVLIQLAGPLREAPMPEGG